VWAGDYADNEVYLTEGYCKIKLYEMCGDDNIVSAPRPNVNEFYRYIINHTKKQYIDKLNKMNSDKIHPLPLLTCEGNGRGGGDYYGTESFIGSWARDVISVSNIQPNDFEEFEFDI
jgi:hypothetical protein